MTQELPDDVRHPPTPYFHAQLALGLAIYFTWHPWFWQTLLGVNEVVARKEIQNVQV